jgi:hypothetical protein
VRQITVGLFALVLAAPAAAEAQPAAPGTGMGAGGLIQLIDPSDGILQPNSLAAQCP